MQDLKKKGLSDIVENLFLIILTLSAVTMTSAFVFPRLAALSDIQQSPAYSCIELQTLANPELEITRACRNVDTIEIDLVRSSLNDIEIQDLTFQLDIATFRCGNSCAESCILQDKGSKKTYFFQLNENESPQNVKIFLNSCQLVEAPIGNC